ncbi:ATP-binding protein [Geodermatophilus sabuli]|uniref:Serine/threonine-protein kinase RsbW n=1 Tax=Geodermatophilus sabuli TaxID=1564158 RepID=A0A285EFL7_9ACTN|nr:ATP-binding protein [Geodermatophilus sabuli]MBB3086695.1 serine/threonine-protein kinase RsbW [Geodermatophilus sabuli]SNX97653.1 serine/threonine-protein kinase RsbW [Geodermatophilus sabuli]
MDIAFTVRLPVDGTSVPFVRGLCRQALEHLGVERTAVDEVTLALTEACANVVHHAGEHAEYEVQVAISDALCRISVFDDGDGLEPEALPDATGRSPLGGGGLRLMQALVDRLSFRHESDGRHRVTLDKRLSSPPPQLRLVDPV